ncbi:MAG TPA: hypothetical protein VFQ39_15185 [Longimicrobium sp.]|nr:hypothetical protein [Longimicrobium sp.]
MARARSPLTLLAASVLLAACGKDPHVPVEVPLLVDNFNSENAATPALMFKTFTNWTVEDGTVDLVGANSDWDFVPGNGLYVDLDGDRPDGFTFDSGRLASKQVFALTPGTYILRYRLAGSQRGDTNITRVSLGEVYDESIGLASNTPFQPVERVFKVKTTTQARLVFENQGADGFGLLLDDVSLVRLD